MEAPILVVKEPLPPSDLGHITFGCSFVGWLHDWNLARRELDIIVYGASGFVGKLLADYLVKHAPEGTKIGLGGRSLEKLAATRADLGTAAADLP